jgi:hypothetical protein
MDKLIQVGSSWVVVRANGERIVCHNLATAKFYLNSAALAA